jgi:hypothetical protein
MQQYASKLLLKCLVSIVAMVISAYVARHDTLDGAGTEAPLSFVGAVVNRIGGMFGGTSQGNVAASTGSSDIISSVGSAPADSDREIDRSDRKGAVPNITRTAESAVVPVSHKHVLGDKSPAKRKAAAATRLASVIVDPPVSYRALPEKSAMIVSQRVAPASQKTMVEDDISPRSFETGELPPSTRVFRSVTGSLWHLPDLWLARAREYDRLRSLPQRFHSLSHLIQTEVGD